MSVVGKPQLVTEIPHSRLQWIIELLLDTNSVSTLETLAGWYVGVSFEERIADAYELKFVAQSFLQIKFNAQGEVTRKDHQRIAADDQSAKLVNARVEMVKLLPPARAFL